MTEKTTDRERVQLALTTESDGGDFYRQATQKTDHKLARAAFEMLAKEEDRHVAIIQALAKHLKGEDAPLDVDSPTLKDLQSDVKTIYGAASEEGIEGKLDPAETYRKAIELEKRISSLYHGYIEECDSDEARRLFEVLHREEQNHLALLEDMLGYLTKPDQWFIDRDMVMLDGG